MGFAGKQVFNAIALIGVVTVIALGLYVVFRMMGVINMAIGDFVMLGAYGNWFFSRHGFPFVLSVVLATAVVVAIGGVLERVVLRRLYPRQDYLSPLLATWGFSLVIQQLISIALGARDQFLAVPVRGSHNMLGAVYPYYSLVVTGVMLVTIVGVAALITMSSFGLKARATIEDIETAEALEVNTRRMFSLTFALGTGLAAFAGAMIAPVVSINPTMGVDYVVRAFLIVVTAGLGGVFGAIGAGSLVGGTESGFASTSSTSVGQIVVLVVVIVLVFVRPRGLFARGTEGS